MNYLVICLFRPLMEIIISGRKKVCEMLHLLSLCRKCLQSLDIYWFKEQGYTNCHQCEPLGSCSRILTDGYSLFRITEMWSRAAFGWSIWPVGALQQQQCICSNVRPSQEEDLALSWLWTLRIVKAGLWADSMRMVSEMGSNCLKMQEKNVVC